MKGFFFQFINFYFTFFFLAFGKVRRILSSKARPFCCASTAFFV
eukprot:SAG22_NODE_2582_length_2417_cov_2.970233_5_plen_44_part_00